MKVLRASLAGFCMGVSLALRKLEAARQANGQGRPNLRICTLGPIIHNPQVLEKLQSLGIASLKNCEEIRKNDHVLIRAHGIPREMENQIMRTAGAVVDATCPKVKNAQLSILKATSPDLPLLLFGEPDHPEVRGLVSYAANETIVFQSLPELQAIALNPARRYVLASQTTQDKKIFSEIVQKLSARLPSLKVLDTICDATAARQRQTLEIAGKVEVMIVAGGKQSGNTRRLASIAAETGIPVFHAETIADLRVSELKKYTIAGLTAGASTPANLIDEMEHWLLDL